MSPMDRMPTLVAAAAIELILLDARYYRIKAMSKLKENKTQDGRSQLLTHRALCLDWSYVPMSEVVHTTGDNVHPSLDKRSSMGCA